MTKTVLILGSTGRFGRAALAAFSWAGWATRVFDRSKDTLEDAAWGADVIVNGWNPDYTKWANDVPRFTQEIIEVAQNTGATVIIPGNIYSYGAQMPSVLTSDTPHAPTNQLAQIRYDMEQAYHASGVRTIILRAGDFIDTEASGNWFDKIITANIVKGHLSYPGNLDIPHAWAFLPDLADATVALAENREALPRFADIPFPGYTLTAQQMKTALEKVIGDRLTLTEMNWLPIQLLKPFWPLAKHLLAMRYLWNTPHQIAADRFEEVVPDFEPTPLWDALSASLPEDIYPNRPVPRPKSFFGYCCRPMNA